MGHDFIQAAPRGDRGGEDGPKVDHMPYTLRHLSSISLIRYIIINRG